ncbi:MAG: biotin transporter BioY [Anaerolineae bacterium]|nr:biotin transporter BioY [Anaerolineae bacterium]MCA9910473.1 biotin transporter BioY [Anaerolineae bacterium]
MLRTLPQTRDWTLAQRLAGVIAFALVTAVSARISIPMEPVPFTFQPLAVLLAGMILGARDGMASQLLYVLMIAGGLPVDSRALGPAALLGPTAGYIYGFVPAAFVVGWIAQQRQSVFWVRLIAGIAGIVVIYVFGLSWLMATRTLDFNAAWLAGGAAFILPDLVKAVIAATLTQGGRLLWDQRPL